MALGSIIVAVNILNSRNISPTLLPLKRNTTEKSIKRKTYQGDVSKNLFFLSIATNKQSANQSFYDTLTKLVPNSQLQNGVAGLKQQVLEAKKAALQK